MNGHAAMRTLAASLGVSDRVQIRDTVPASAICAVLRECDIYVQLAQMQGSPLSLNDALALGKPAIVSDRVGTASCAEIVRLPHVKIVEPRVPAAARAITDCVDRLGDLRAAARLAHPALREFLSWERAAREHLRIYQSLILERRDVA